MALKRRLFSTPARKGTQAKRIRQLERKVNNNKTEVQTISAYVTASLRSTFGSAGPLNGFMNNVISTDFDGRNYKTVMVKASLAMDASLLSADNYRYRFILFANKNNSSRDNTQVTGGERPAPYDDALSDLTLDFNIDPKKWVVYDDKIQAPRRDILAGSPQNQIGYGGLSVQKMFRTPKLVRIDANNGSISHGAIGLAIYRQSLSTGAVELVTESVTDAPRVNVIHKYVDP